MLAFVSAMRSSDRLILNFGSYVMHRSRVSYILREGHGPVTPLDAINTRVNRTIFLIYMVSRRFFQPISHYLHRFYIYPAIGADNT